MLSVGRNKACIGRCRDDIHNAVGLGSTAAFAAFAWMALFFVILQFECPAEHIEETTHTRRTRLVLQQRVEAGLACNTGKVIRLSTRDRYMKFEILTTCCRALI